MARHERLVELFNGIGKQLSMDEFEDRLEVQKIPYLAQQYGLDLGYTFSWYLKGPYSKQVTQDGFLIHNTLQRGEQIKPGHFLDKQILQEFREIIEPHMNDPTWLEIAGSLLYLRNEMYSGRPLDQIIGLLIEDLTCGYKNFDESLVRVVISDVISSQLLQ